MEEEDLESFVNWYPRPELNWNQLFRKPLLYPFELRRQPNERDRAYRLRFLRQAGSRVPTRGVTATTLRRPSEFAGSYAYQS